MALIPRPGTFLAMVDELTHTMRELDSRSGDGIVVQLLWDEFGGDVRVPCISPR